MNPTQTPALGTPEYTNYLVGQGNSLGMNLNQFRVPTTNNAPISTDVLETQPLRIPPVTETTNAMGLSGMAAGVFESDALYQEEVNELREIGVQKKKDSSGIKDTMTRILGLQAGRGEAEEDAGIPQMNEDVNRANQAYLSSQRAEVNELRALEMQPGITASGKQQAQSAIQRKYAFQNADNALTLSLARQDLATAQTILDRKYELQLEPLKTALEYQKFFYEDNKEDLTKAEDRQFQLMVTENERQYNFKLAEYNSIGELALMAGKNGAPPSLVTQISNAPTKAEALSLASGYATDPLDRQLKQAQINKINAEVNPAGGVNIMGVDANGNPIVTPQSQALQVILGSGKFTKEQVKLVTNAINNGEDPFTVIKNQAKAIMTGANQTKVESYETAQDALNNLETTLDVFYASGGNTGLLKGNYEKVVNKLGQVTDPKLVEIATQIQQNLQIYRNAVSGTAYSVQEGADIASIFPGISKSQGLNKAIITGRKRAFEDGIGGAYRGVLGSAYDSLRKTETAAPVVPAEETTYGGLFEGKDYRSSYGY